MALACHVTALSWVLSSMSFDCIELELSSMSFDCIELGVI